MGYIEIHGLEGTAMKWMDHLNRMFTDPATGEAFRDRPEGLEGFRGAWNVLAGHFRNAALYNPLGLVAGIVFAWTLFHPWWYAYVYNNEYSIRAFPFILRHDLPSEGLPYVIETPHVAVAILILLLAGYLFLTLWGSTMGGKKGGLFLLFAGIFMLLYAAGFYGAILFATHRVQVPVTGYASINHTVTVDIYMFFTREYFIAIGAGAVSALSALLHGIIVIPPSGRKRAS
jgi:hypothetical protein